MAANRMIFVFDSRVDAILTGLLLIYFLIRLMSTSSLPVAFSPFFLILFYFSLDTKSSSDGTTGNGAMTSPIPHKSKDERDNNGDQSAGASFLTDPNWSQQGPRGPYCPCRALPAAERDLPLGVRR